MQEVDILRQLGIELPESIDEVNTQAQVQPQIVPPPMGAQEMAYVQMAVAVMLLEDLLGVFGITSEEGKRLEKAIKSLSEVLPPTILEQVKQARGMLLSGGLGATPIPPIIPTIGG